MFKKLLFSTLLILSYTQSSAQYGNYITHEFGFHVGPTFFQSDFGERGNLSNATGNIGYNIAAFYYIPFNNRRSEFSDNFRLKTEVSFFSTSLKHHGKYSKSETVLGKKLKNMRSKIESLNLGVHLEYFPWKTDSYHRNSIFYPYLSFGPQLSSYNVEAYSLLGPLGHPNTTSEKYYDGFKSNSGLTFSLVGGMGTRIMFDSNNGMSIEGRLQYYFTDWIDGMNPDRRIYKENKTNDWMATLNIGYILIID